MENTTTPTTTDTPRTDACPHCGSPRISPLCAYFTCEADTTQRDEDKRTHLCREREKSQKLEAEVERLRGIANRAISTLVIVTYGEETIDFEWLDIMRKVCELRNEFPFLGSTTEDSSAPQL